MRSRKLLEIREKVIESLRELKKRINCKVYLFGSFAMNTYLVDSDVDVVIVSEVFKGLNIDERVVLVRRLLPKDRSFDIIPLTFEEFERKLQTSTFFKQISRYWIEID